MLLLLVSTGSSHAEAAGNFQVPPMTPALLDDDNYSEFWQQVFLFEDGTFVTSEFLILNLGFSTHHGIMLSTLVRPNGDRYIIKNGRTRSGWNYQSDPFSIQIYQHSLASSPEGLVLNLHNSTAQVNLNLTTVAQPWDAVRYEAGRNGWQEVTFYAPALLAEGYWTPGPASGLDETDQIPIELKGGYGYGVHSIQSAKLHEIMSSWLKVFAYGNENQARPFINSIVRQDGIEENTMTLYQGGLADQTFENIEMHIVDTQEIEGTLVPYVIEVTASDGATSLSGTLQLSEILETFVLNDHLNMLERAAARSEPKLKRYRFRAEYDFVIVGNDTTVEITGNALSEYIDVVPPQAAPRRRSRR